MLNEIYIVAVESVDRQIHYGGCFSYKIDAVKAAIKMNHEGSEDFPIQVWHLDFESQPIYLSWEKVYESETLYS